MQQPRRVLISLGSVGSVHDGLGEFCTQLGLRIAAQARLWREQHGVQFHFHARGVFHGRFGDDVSYWPLGRSQQWWPQFQGSWALWHSLHQLNRSLPPRQVGPRLVTVHDLNYSYGRNAFSTWRHHRRAMALAQRSDHMVAISQHTASDVQRVLDWRGPLEVIYNGARSLVGAPQEPLPGWAAAGKARPFLFHLSRMNASKNPAALIELARHWPDMHFVLCGPDNEHSRKLQAGNALPNVEFHLAISDAQKAWAYAHCTGFLFPSLTEGFGLPPIEAMHFGKPCFLARRTCLPEIGGEQADYFDHFEPAAMKQVVQLGLQRMQQPGHKAAIQAAIQAHAARFDWDRCAAAYLALYQRLLKLQN